MLQLVKIHKKYEGAPLLRGLSFSVLDGDTVCLLGPSGGGKSTLLRIIAGLEEPDSGRVLWNGADVTSMPPHQRDFGLVFQDYALFPHMDVAANIAFGLKMRAWSRDEIETRLEEVLELVNLRGFETRRVTELSGGEQQRVALARALAPRPRLLMFDEPLGALDRTLKEDLLAELRGILHETRVPALYVTHDQEEAFTVADRIVILHEGRIACEGTPAEVVENPSRTWVARFLGLGHLLQGRVAGQKSGVAKVETALGKLEARCEQDLHDGQEVWVLVRPEQVRLGDGRNSLKSRVTDVVFQKDGYRIMLDNGLSMKLNRPLRLHERVEVEIEEAECLT